MNKIVWQEGMLLRPQHLQQQDRYYQQQTRHLLQTSVPNNWGFFEIAIDQQYLMMGKIVISHAAGILPDGTLFRISLSSRSKKIFTMRWSIWRCR